MAPVSSIGSNFTFVPRTCVNEDGRPGDPLNLVVEGSRDQIIRTFEQAGWTRPDRLSLWSALKMIYCTLFRKPYPDAPVSSLYLGSDKHPEDLAFEHTSGTTKVRDHVRFWDTGRKDANGQDIWVGAASKDIGIERNKLDLGPTHRISPDVDSERDLVDQVMISAGAVSLGTWQRGAWSAINGEGDPYRTDGEVDVLQVGQPGSQNVFQR